MALLRESAGEVSAEAVAEAWPDEEQRRRVLAGLVADGLAEATPAPDDASAGPVAYRLPGRPAASAPSEPSLPADAPGAADSPRAPSTPSTR